MQPRELIKEIGNGFVDLVYPPVCLVCNAPGTHPICAACRDGFTPLRAPICQRCGISAGADPCRECAADYPRYFALARAAGQFDGSLRAAIIALKYHLHFSLAPELGAYLARYLAQAPFGSVRIDLIVPVPLHPSRLRERGFNQSELLARAVSQRLNIPVAPHALRRTRRTRPQAELGPHERAANVRDAFAVSRVVGVSGRTVLLVDDVVTTCHTVDECARILLNAGAEAVYIASVARGG